ncbi:MAG: NAD(P)-dependent oxidoreductase [Bacilli bacterium]|nr:NAD(P)-dependent oxidoreductase [Bacilli bacterium]
MKDVLITGGAGKIGFNLVEKLVETNCNITVLDLESRDSLKKFVKIKDQVKVVYGDIEDANLVRDLVKRNDIVIDYAGIMPPLADLNETIANSTNFNGTKNIVDAINELNPECAYIYMSFISVYGQTQKKVRKLSIDTESTHPEDYYSISLIRSEDYIRSNLKKYAILRMPIVLTRKNHFINHMRLDRTIDFITKENLNDLVLGIMRSSKIYGKTFNISGFKAKGREVVELFYKATGSISILGRNIYYGEYEDSDRVDKIFKVDYSALSNVEIDDGKSRIRVGFKKFVNYPRYLLFKFKTRNIKK